MSATTILAAVEAARNPRTRYDGGFDRWNRVSRSGWTILRPDSDNAVYALGDQDTVWTWDDAGRIWNRLPADREDAILHAHELTMRHLRRGALVIRLLKSEVPAERQAARGALQRIADAVIEDWRQEAHTHCAERDFAWLDHPAAIYLVVAHDARFHQREGDRVPFDADVFAALVAGAQTDFEQGRRVKPPRLRPGDLVRLQAQRPAPATAAASDDSFGAVADNMPAGVPSGVNDNDGYVPEECHVPGAPPPPESEHMIDLRRAVRETVAREVHWETRQAKSRRVSTRAAAIIAVLLLAAFVVRIF